MFHIILIRVCQRFWKDIIVWHSHSREHDFRVIGQGAARFRPRRSFLRGLTFGLVAAIVHACLTPDGVSASEPLRPPSYQPADIAFSGLSLGRKPEEPTSFRPRPDLEAWDVSLPIDWGADPFRDPNWQFQLHAWRVMEFQLHEYRESGDPVWLRQAIAIALDWAHYHVDLGRSEEFSWYDMSAGIRAARLAFILDRILAEHVHVSDSELKTLVNLADLHAERLQNTGYLAKGNHAIFQLVGLDMLCAVIAWRNACGEGTARRYARESFESSLKAQFTEEGVHTESSPAYHRWVLKTLRDSGAIERLGTPSIVRFLEGAEEISPWLAYPDKSWIAVGDSAGFGPRLTSPVPETCLTAMPDSCWAVRDLTRSGYGIVRSLPDTPRERSSLLFVSGMADRSGHKHADDLAFVLMEGGQKIFVDSGKYGYTNDEARRYVRSARAHNTISLADRAIMPRDIDIRQVRMGPIGQNGTHFVIAGAVVRPDLFRHERVFRYRPGVSLRIDDRVYNETGSRWVSNLHLAPGLVPEVEGKGFAVQVGDRAVHAAFDGPACELIATMGATEPHQGWVSTGYLELTPAYVVSASCPADLVESSWQIDLAP